MTFIDEDNAIPKLSDEEKNALRRKLLSKAFIIERVIISSFYVLLRSDTELPSKVAPIFGFISYIAIAMTIIGFSAYFLLHIYTFIILAGRDAKSLLWIPRGYFSLEFKRLKGLVYPILFIGICELSILIFR